MCSSVLPRGELWTPCSCLYVLGWGTGVPLVLLNARQRRESLLDAAYELSEGFGGTPHTEARWAVTCVDALKFYIPPRWKACMDPSLTRWFGGTRGSVGSKVDLHCPD